ncbi:MAG: cupin domain-containing protein [Labilithrix sp.]|nr:cupin domain-containing protein [Labilithrix sp.]
MKTCRSASIVAIGALGVMTAIGACAEAKRVNVPPVTVAFPAATASTASSIMTDGLGEGGAGGAVKALPVTASFVDVPASVPAAPCSRVMIAIAKGKATVGADTLAAGDAIVVTHPEPLDLKGAGLALVVTEALPPSACVAKTTMDKKVVPRSAAPKLAWAGGAMSAHLDVGTNLSPDVYLGRLEGTASVPEHTHAGTWEILAAVEASGTFVLDGVEARLGPRQIVFVPPGAKHAWKADPGTKLVALQMYSPPGPEQRFVALDAAEKAEKDAGADAAKE